MEWSELYRCEAAALRVAEQHDVAASHLLGLELDVAGTGRSALLITYLPGTTRIPVDTNPQRLRSAAEVAAAIHSVLLEPSNELPRRTRHTCWTNFALWRRWARRYAAATSRDRDSVVEAFLAEHPTGGTGTMTGATPWPVAAGHETLSTTASTPLLDAADEVLAATTRPSGATVFVHGDLWHGNLLWEDDRCIAAIDWELAGAGDPGVDLGCLRWDAAMLHGASAADEILAGWEQAVGRPAGAVAYWDLAAALNYPADIGRLAPVLGEFGRPDLDAEKLEDRRDRFVEDALGRL